VTLVAVSTVEWVVRGVIALGAALMIYIIGAAILRKFKVIPDEEPDPEHVVAVNERFRCIVCGAEVTMTAAQDGDVEAPRHCREDMVPA
jgi:hypothetical protein